MPSKWGSDGNLIDGQYEIAGSKVQDAGLAVTAANMAAGALAIGNWIDGISWVRNTVAIVQSDQQYDFGFYRRDASGAADQGLTIASAQTSTGGTSSWRSHAMTGGNGLLGYSARFYIKNSAAVPNTFANARVQLLGL